MCTLLLSSGRTFFTPSAFSATTARSRLKLATVKAIWSMTACDAGRGSVPPRWIARDHEGTALAGLWTEHQVGPVAGILGGREPEHRDEDSRALV
jgi:hypothetical protein